ncbi:thioesterase family protein [Trujillonella endophytica]|uniref:Thioesterase-like superfamily protein n=1 Tax=Trujillonella endophytica TaxID=673521 RepID=A0A1H8T286_9ACTN|nr:thioesterase family protein [Trujillella endophytica]SEO85081.1 Thioesterase-like superfamily protein [Trujillella endophytica]
MDAGALFVRDGDGYVATECTQGAWDPRHANGGSTLALLGQVLDTVPTLVPMTVSRMTADLVRPLPVGRRLTVEPTVVREGKKIQLVDLHLLVDGELHARASALRLRDADLSALDGLPTGAPADGGSPLVPPEEVPSLRESASPARGFLRGVDMRYAPSREGSTTGLWIRLEVPVVAGEPVRPSARLAVSFDYANNMGVDFGAATASTINPDVSAHVLRQQTGEWVAITGLTRFTPTLGRGVVRAALHDGDGVFAEVTIGQLVQPLPR